MMTPLPRWVLLVTLLGWATGVPIHEEEDACVRFCRTLGAFEACDLQILALLQSYERHVGKRDELARCFLSCEEDEDSPRDERKEICERTRKDFIQSGRCGCVDPLQKIPSKNFDLSKKEDLSWVVFEDILVRYHRYLFEVGVPGTLDLVEESEEDSSEVSIDIDRLQSKLDESGDFEIKEEKVSTFDEEAQEKPNKMKGQLATTTEATSEEHVDWDRWCMTQCDHGTGGSACNCDIIP